MITLAELVNQRLHKMIVQLADDIATDKVELDLTEDEAAGIPMALFKAEQVMRDAFELLISYGSAEE